MSWHPDCIVTGRTRSSFIPACWKKFISLSSCLPAISLSLPVVFLSDLSAVLCNHCSVPTTDQVGVSTGWVRCFCGQFSFYVILGLVIGSFFMLSLCHFSVSVIVVELSHVPFCHFPFNFLSHPLNSCMSPAWFQLPSFLNFMFLSFPGLIWNKQIRWNMIEAHIVISLLFPVMSLSFRSSLFHVPAHCPFISCVNVHSCFLSFPLDSFDVCSCTNARKKVRQNARYNARRYAR